MNPHDNFIINILSCHYYIYSETTIDANPPQFKLRDWNHKGFIYPYNCYWLQNINAHIAVSMSHIEVFVHIIRSVGEKKTKGKH